MNRRLVFALVLTVGCDTDDGDDVASTGSSGTASSGASTSGDTGTSTTAAPTTDSSTTATPTSTSTTTPSGSSSSGDPQTDPMVLAMCQCLLINCHDPYHEQYGETDFDAAIACNEDGDSLPLEGDGDSVQCRLDACSMSDCEAGLGMAAPCQ